MTCPHGASSDDCGLCAKTLAASGNALSDAWLSPGTQVGRYVIGERLGEGGMGVVYRAKDPQLERTVAIKLVRGATSEAGGSQASTGQARLLREAQAMAQLAHPNVVPVYDSGSYGDGVFIAMELVEGSTLDHWVKVAPRAWREVLRIYIEAGRGLAAAHARGLVHRDFKPMNVLLGANDGRPRVTDFGLARSTTALDEPVTSDDTPTQPGGFATPLTQAGMMMGSPGYMAPEQYLGAATSPATDQFAFCISLYEGVYGERPFEGDNVVELASATSKHEVRAAPKGTPVPGWLRRILLRGLQPDQAQRFPSMNALLLALSTDPAVVRQRRLLISAAVLAALVVGGNLWSARARGRACQGQDRLLTGVWDAPAKEAGRQAFIATKLPLADRSWALVSARLDQFARAWVRERTAACEARTLRRENTERQMLLRFECLDHRLEELQTFTDTFRHADATVVENASTAVTRLPALSPCGDVSRLEDRRAPPVGRETEAREAASLLAQGRALSSAGKDAEARTTLTAVITIARALEMPSLQAEAFERLGLLDLGEHDFGHARVNFESALRSAEASADDVVAARVAARLVSLVGWRLEKPDEATTWAALAQGILERAGGDPGTAALIDEGLGDATWQAGRRDDALVFYRRALAGFQVSEGEKSVNTARLHSSVGWMLTEQGQLDEARTEIEQSRAIREALLGPLHHDYVATFNELGALSQELRDYAECIALGKRAMAGLGDDDGAHTRSQRHNLSAAYLRSGDLEAAKVLNDRVLFELDGAARWAGLGLSARGIHGWLVAARGDPKQGFLEAKSALDDATRIFGVNHPFTAENEVYFSHAAALAGRWLEARTHMQHALAQRTSDSPLVGEELVVVLRAQVALKDMAGAAVTAARALAALKKGVRTPALEDEIRRLSPEEP